MQQQNLIIQSEEIQVRSNSISIRKATRQQSILPLIDGYHDLTSATSVSSQQKNKKYMKLAQFLLDFLVFVLSSYFAVSLLITYQKDYCKHEGFIKGIQNGLGEFL